MPFYATADCNGDSIPEWADIRRFDTEAEARAFLLAGYSRADGWLPETAVIEPGRFSDCWIKSDRAPRVGEWWIKPFSRAQLSVRGPGEHPGGVGYWIKPVVEVLVIEFIAQAEEDAP